MNKRKQKIQFFRRLGVGCAALLLCVGVLALPLNWDALGRDAACLAAGLRQPYRAAALLEQSLFEQPAAPTQTPTASPAGQDFSEDRADTGLLELPASTPAVTLPAITMIAPPGKKGNGGKISEQKMNTGDRHKTGIATVNRSGKKEDIPAALADPLPVAFTDTAEPQVLILHTHTTEGYMTYDADYYNAGDRDRTKDHKKNVCAVGEAIRLTLEAAGIGVIHDTTVHDSPQYSGAYNRSAATAQTYLKKYPSIKVVLDVHRDAVLDGSGTVIKPTATVKRKKAAQMMLITGTVTTSELPHRDWRKNLALSTQLQRELDRVSPDLMRPLNTVASRYNQHLSPGWILVEVGSEGNTVEEAVYSGQLLADTLAKLLKA